MQAWLVSVELIWHRIRECGFGGQSQSSKRKKKGRGMSILSKLGQEEDALKKLRRKINSWKKYCQVQKEVAPLHTPELLARCWASRAWLARPLRDGATPAGWHGI